MVRVLVEKVVLIIASLIQQLKGMLLVMVRMDLLLVLEEQVLHMVLVSLVINR